MTPRAPVRELAELTPPSNVTHPPVRPPGPVDAAGGAELVYHDLPFALQVEITSRCNLRCQMCPLTSGSTASRVTPGHISEATWAEVLRLARASRQIFVAGFGEPTTNPRCLELLRDLDSESIHMTLVTNGLAVTRSMAHQLAALEYLDHINVSIDSPDPDVYFQIRGTQLDRAWRGLSNLMVAMTAAGRRHRVSVSSVAMQSNVASLARFPAVLADVGVVHYIVQGLVEYNDFARGQRLTSSAELADEFEQLRAACQVHGIQLQLTTPERSLSESAGDGRAGPEFFRSPGPGEEDTRQCMLPWELPYIDKDAKVFSCCYAASSHAEPLGQVGPATLEEIWVGRAYQAFRRDLLDGRTAPAPCRSCTAVKLGPHPLREYRAEVVSTRVTRTSAGAQVTVQVRNTGARTWARGEGILVGTARPRDMPSPLAHQSWPAANRAGSFGQDSVPVGARATFEFLTQQPPDGADQMFQVVVEGLCWLPNTQFTVHVPPRQRWWRSGHRQPPVLVRTASPVARGPLG